MLALGDKMKNIGTVAFTDNVSICPKALPLKMVILVNTLVF